MTTITKTSKTIKKMKTIKLLAILFIAGLTFTACSDDDHDHDDHDHEEEVITTATYTLTNGSDVVTLKYQDSDGEGGNPGTYTVSGPLTANSIYTGVIKLENETETPADDVTVEVKNEADEHEFFYTSSISNVTITKTDNDGNGNPLGITTKVITGTAGSGNLTVVLKHEPKKPNDGTVSDAGGSTDLEVSFSITVQ